MDRKKPINLKFKHTDDVLDQTFAHGFWIGFMAALFVITIAVSIMLRVN